jgi:hypothetical protein
MFGNVALATQSNFSADASKTAREVMVCLSPPNFAPAGFAVGRP